MHKDLESIQEARDLTEAAFAAFQAFEHFTAEQVDRILAEVSKAGIAHAGALAKIAVEETGYGTIQQGFLETSNVNSVDEITSLITAQRAYEMNSKVISAADQMLQNTAHLGS